MSSIEIRKYEYQADRAKNYFASPTYVDGIVLTSILIDGFPIFNEEFANEFDSFEYKASDYDLVFSRLEDTLTTTLSQSLETFLSTDLDNHCLVCKVTIGSKVFGGLIDVNSITFIDDLNSDGYKIKVTIFSLAKEFSLATQGKPDQPSFQVNPFNQYISATNISGTGNAFFNTVDSEKLPNYVQIDADNLNWVSRVGYEPVVINELWAFVLTSGTNDDVVCWKLFEDLCTSFGIIYKFDFTGDFGNYFEITMTLAFRDTGFTSETLSVDWLSRERGFISDINANVIQCFKHQKEATVIGSGTVPIEINDSHFYGTVFNKDEITTADGDVYSLAGGFGEESLYSNGEGITINKLSNPFPFDVSDKVNFIDMNYYFAPNYFTSPNWYYYVMANSSDGWYTSPNVRKPKYISFPRMFTKAGYLVTTPFGSGVHRVTTISHPENIHTLWETLMNNTGGTCYPFLLQTFKKCVSGKIRMPDDFDINLFDKIEVNDETYTIFKLSNLDFKNRDVDIFAIQD